MAIKVINLKKLTQSYHRQLLNNEVEVLLQLKSPNILKVFDIFSSQNNTYIITEFCDKGDLASHIKKQGFLQEAVAV